MSNRNDNEKIISDYKSNDNLSLSEIAKVNSELYDNYSQSQMN